MKLRILGKCSTTLESSWRQRAATVESISEFLIKKGYANKKDLIKILGRGSLKVKINVTAHYFSASSIKVIEKLGGKVDVETLHKEV